MLRYHDPKNFAQIRKALVNMGREDLIGRGPQHLVPPETAEEKRQRAPKGRKGERAMTKHTGFGKYNRPKTQKGGKAASNGKGNKGGKGKPNVTR